MRTPARTAWLPWTQVLLAPALAAQTPAEAAARLAADPLLRGARVGVVVLDTDSGRVLCERDADKGFMTASNMKLISSATALVTLGPEFRYRTRLVATGPFQDGVVHGDLVLVGSGDPTLGGRHEDDPDDVFERMVASIDGLRRVTGSVIGDDDCHPDEVMGEGWSWGYQGSAYAAQVSGLCFAENCVALTVASGAPGEPPSVSPTPATAFFQLDVRARCERDLGASEASLWVDRVRATNVLRVGGSLPVGAEPSRHRCSVENPTAYAATVLRETLVRHGVEVDGPALDRDLLPERPERYGDETVLAEHASQPLREILVTLNKVSQNLYAEQVIRTASRSVGGDGGMQQAAAHAKSVLAGLGVDVHGMRIGDGSGLTRLNLVEPRQIAELLRGMWRHEHRDVFVSSLPIAGVDGTLAKRFPDGPARGRVCAKTGYISSVVALSGYVLRPDDDTAPPLLFSVLVNNFTADTESVQRAVDAFVQTLAR